MNKGTLPLLLVILLASCMSEPTGSPEMLKNKEKRDSLKSVIAELSADLKDIEEWIEANDSTQLKKLPLVTTIAFEKRPYEHFVEVHGSVKADRNAMLYSTMGGEVRRILIRQGSRVKKGQLLVDVEADALRQNIAQMKSQLDLAEDVYERQERLWNSSVGSEVQYLQAKTNKESLEASLAGLREQLKSTLIYAPFTGVVDEIFPNVGDMVTPMNPVLRIVALGRSSIECDVAERYLNKVKVGDPVTVRLVELDTMLTATVDQVGSFINPGNRTFKINLRIENGMELRPNQLASVRIRDVTLEKATVLDPRYIMEDAEGRSYVYIANTDEEIARVKKVYVERLISGANEVLVEDTEYLENGVRIIDQGARLIVADQRVRMRSNT